MIIDFYGNGGGSGGVTSGEVENMISSALTDYYTSNETDEAIDDAVDAIDFDTLEAVPDFPSAATQGDVVAKVTEGEPMLSWTFPGVDGWGGVATITNTFNISDIPTGVTYKIASWTSIGNSELPELGPHLFEYYLIHSGDTIVIKAYANNADYTSFEMDNTQSSTSFGPMNNDGINYELPQPFSEEGDWIRFDFNNPNLNGEGCSLCVSAGYNGGNDEYNDSLVSILNLEPFGPASEGTMGVYQYDGTNWNLIEGGGSGNIVTLTQQEYEALTTKDPDTLYVISDATPIDLADYAMNSAVTALQASKADAQTVSAVTGTSSPYYFPTWNSQGVITGQKSDTIYPKSFSINGSSNSGFLRTSNSNPTGFYAPTAAGTAGQMLMSAGSGAPTWTTYKFAFLTQTEYDALTTPDATTFYFITGD